MMGIPEDQHGFVARRTNTIIGFTDPEYIGISRDYLVRHGAPGRRHIVPFSARLMKAGWDLIQMVRKLGEERSREPRDDLISALVSPNSDGERLSPRDVGTFFILLVIAGNETTRNVIAHAVALFTTYPDQRELLLADYDTRIGPAIEEIVRYVSPVIQFRRTVTRDCELAGREFSRGDKVMLYYNSANRDDAVFTDPDRFDISRSPNPHVGFGGPGPHYNMGANLARREVTVMLRELYTRLPDPRMVGEPEPLLSFFVNGIKRMRFETGPYYGAELRLCAIAVTFIGPRIDPDARVLRPDTSPIPGPFAAGECTGNILGDTYLGTGNSVTNCVVFGRTAGRSAADHARGSSGPE